MRHEKGLVGMGDLPSSPSSPSSRLTLSLRGSDKVSRRDLCRQRKRKATQAARRSLHQFRKRRLS